MNRNDTIESLTAAYLEGRLSPEEAERDGVRLVDAALELWRQSQEAAR